MGEKITINNMLFLLASCQPTINPLLLVKRGQKTSHAKLVANSTSLKKISHAEFVTNFTTFGFFSVAHVILFLPPPTTIHMVVYICTSVWLLFQVSSSDQALTFLCCVHITSLTIPRYLCWVSYFTLLSQSVQHTGNLVYIYGSLIKCVRTVFWCALFYVLLSLFQNIYIHPCVCVILISV
jgi:hypothetical protein